MSTAKAPAAPRGRICEKISTAKNNRKLNTCTNYQTTSNVYDDFSHDIRCL